MNIINVPAHPSNFLARNAPKKGVVLHWIVGELSAADTVFQTAGKQVSAHYAISSTGLIHQYVPDSQVAYHSGNSQINLDYIGIEHAGGQLINGTRKKPTQQAHDTSAELLANLSKKHGWGQLEYKKNVFRHRDIVATECCGTLDVEYIIIKANEILNIDMPTKLSQEDINYLRSIGWIENATTLERTGLRNFDYIDRVKELTKERERTAQLTAIINQDSSEDSQYQAKIKELQDQLAIQKTAIEQATISSISENIDQYIDPNKFIRIEDHIRLLDDAKHNNKHSLSVVTRPSRKWSWHEFSIGLAEYGITDLASGVTVISTLPQIIDIIIAPTNPTLAAQLNSAIIALIGVVTVIVSSIKSTKKFATGLKEPKTQTQKK